MIVEIIDRRLTAIAGVSIAEVQLGLAIALTVAIIGILAFMLLVLRTLFAWR
jgi:hypothetical protein